MNSKTSIIGIAAHDIEKGDVLEYDDTGKVSKASPFTPKSMNYAQAIAAARSGKNVECFSSGGVWVPMVWMGDALYYQTVSGIHRQPATITKGLLDAEWRIVQPKQYDFAEAYEMMKRGRRMKPCDGGRAYYFDGANWAVAGDVWNMAAFTPEHIDGKWVEE